ncbi:hypothetical protein [Planococcus wigleyi]|uniref:Uncharacterized protein n=1 Tax=Planococcus wigleyi TaxID=2762216 RepID=A0ABR8WC36_9BACL|nr:hypothetical protein [Planococcus wigleyi]MBD8014488.1 hypothetical protein [Planococcus wigleyi]
MKTKLTGTIADDIEGNYGVNNAAKFGQSTIIVQNEVVSDSKEKMTSLLSYRTRQVYRAGSCRRPAA